jgi:DNA-binding IclR family transcriptional regulator
MSEQMMVAIVQFLAAHPGSSQARVAKQLGFAQSELLRCLSSLCEPIESALVERIGSEESLRLNLSERGQAFVAALT